MRQGISAAEMVVAALILGAALVPMYQMFVKGSTTVTQSRLAYLALQVAREELEEIRQIPFESLQPHPFRRVQGHLFQLSFGARAPAGNAVRAQDRLSYPEEYSRIWTRLNIDPVSGDPRLRKVTLDVKWEETGTGSERAKEGLSHYETLLGSHQMEKL